VQPGHAKLVWIGRTYSKYMHIHQSVQLSTTSTTRRAWRPYAHSTPFMRGRKLWDHRRVCRDAQTCGEARSRPGKTDPLVYWCFGVDSLVNSCSRVQEVRVKAIAGWGHVQAQPLVVSSRDPLQVVWWTRVCHRLEVCVKSADWYVKTVYYN
jgi:hypothetical protein